MMEVQEIKRDETSQRRDLQIAIACIENPVLREYCTEQMMASLTSEEFEATICLVMELAAQAEYRMAN